MLMYACVCISLSLCVELEEATGQYEASRAAVAKIRSVQIDIAHQLEEYSAVVTDNAAKAQHWQSELAKLRKVVMCARRMHHGPV